MADFLCADFDEDDFDTDCVAGGDQPTRVVRSPRYGLTRRVAVGLLGVFR